MKLMDNNYIYNDWTDDIDIMILIIDSFIKNNGNVYILDFAKRCKFWITCGFVERGDLLSCNVGRNLGNIVDDKNFIDDPIKVS